MLHDNLHLEKEDNSLEATRRNQLLKSNNPFPGLKPFTLEDSHLFFGREGQVEDILIKLIDKGFVTAMGASGTGKSSLIDCGLKPILYGGFMTKMASSWTIITARISDSPIDNLAEQFLQNNPNYDQYGEEEKLFHKTIINSILKSSVDGLVELSKQYIRDTGNNLLIYIDQFEELFTSNTDDVSKDIDNETTMYVNLLLQLVKEKKNSVYILLNMCSDHIGDCAKYTGLTQMINASNYLVPQMTRFQLKIAIEGPITVGGGSISDKLVKRLLHDVGDNQESLPLLQHALMRTWDYWAENKNEEEVIDVRHYNAIGQISHALSQHAEEVYEELSVEEKSISTILFKSITQKKSIDFKARSPMCLSTIAEIASVSEQELIEVIEKFRTPERTMLLPNPTIRLDGKSIVEISHESLMQIWVRLKNWIEEEHESAQMYKRLSEAAAMYQIGKAGLWKPPDLHLALNWHKKHKPTRFWGQRYNEAFERAIVFLDTSRITFEAEQNNQEVLQKRLFKRTKIVAVVLGIAAVLSILLLVFAFIQKQIATAAASDARQQEKFALTQEKIAKEQTEVAKFQHILANERNIELAKKQIELEKALKTTEWARDQARMSTGTAQEQTQIATEQKEVAEKETIRANQNYNIATENRYLADNLYTQQLAQSIAIKSLEVEDSNLKGLLAQQAFIFNQESGGRRYDPYIYEGLYFSMAKLDGKAFNTLYAHRNQVRSIVVDNTNTYFYSTGSDGNILEFNIETLELTKKIENNGHSNKVISLSNDNKWLAIGTDSPTVQLYQLPYESKVNQAVQVVDHTSFVYDVKFTSDNRGFYSLSNDRTLRYYDFTRSKLVKEFNSTYKTFDISADGQWMVLGSLEGYVSLLNLISNTEKQILFLPNIPVHDVVFSNKEKYIAIGDENGGLRLWDIKKEAIVEEFKSHKARVNSIAFTKNDDLLASASYDGTIQLWIMDELQKLPIVLRDNDSYVWDITFTHDGRYLIAGGNQGEIRIWPTDASQMAFKICSRLSRNMTEEEWERYIGTSVDFRETCESALLAK